MPIRRIDFAARAGLCAGVALGLWSAAGAAAAQTAPPKPGSIVLRGDQAYDVAIPLLISRGRFAEALALIRTLRPERRAEPANVLLEANLLRRTGAPRQAIDLYRRLLARHPGDQRARLELAQTLFEVKDLRSSEYYFRRALSGPLPDSDRRLARTYLNQILDLRPWSLAGGLGVAPDSNVNGATSAQQIELWGLPFKLSDEARRRGGVTVTGFLSAQGSAPLRPGAKIVGQVWTQASEARQSRFSSEAIGARLGPEFVARDRRWSLSATGETRWYGRRVLYDAAGLQLAGDLAAGDGRTVYSAALAAQKLNYRSLATRDGWAYSLEGARTRYLTPQSFWRASGALRVNRADAKAESYDLGRLAVGAYHTLPLRMAVYVEPSITISRYAGPDSLFGIVREDHETSITARLVKEDYSLWGLSPYVSAQISRTTSSIPLFAFSRRRIEFGLTRTF